MTWEAIDVSNFYPTSACMWANLPSKVCHSKDGNQSRLCEKLDVVGVTSKVDFADGLRRRFLECPKGSTTLKNVSHRSFDTASALSRNC
jgi:hypothetical protein